jgi:hypothetical protein
LFIGFEKDFTCQIIDSLTTCDTRTSSNQEKTQLCIQLKDFDGSEALHHQLENLEAHQLKDFHMEASTGTCDFEQGFLRAIEEQFGSNRYLQIQTNLK